ncbi:MAG TPA: FAD-binding oxidoreductase [Actinomycetes bacterium]|nr:FAD-binding oxidoreductase [Actinomycetes bacterium]
MAAGPRPAGAADAVDGVQPEVVVAPTTVEEASEALREATAQGRRVVCRGVGSKLGWGNPPAGAEVILETARLDRVLEHAEGDLIVKAEAGVRLDALQEALSKAGQHLALDPPEPHATVGGIVAAGASGPRRLRYGTARDLLIGITLVLSDGTVAHGGGKVVKNVAGYDLGKLLTGSLGTLGLIAEVTFRLHPSPDALAGAALEVTDPEAAGSAAQDLVHSQLDPASLELAWPDPAAPGRLVLVLQGRSPAVAEQAGAAVRLLEPHGAAELLADDDVRRMAVGPGGLGARPWWGLDGTWDGAVAGVKAACVPTELPGAVQDLWAAAAAHGLDVRVQAHAGVGVIYAALWGGGVEALAETVEEARGRLGRRGGTLLVLEAPLELKRRVDVWGPVGDALALMRRVKEQFDPAGTMSPGRFVGGI